MVPVPEGLTVTSPNVVLIVMARMGSSRLPGKTLAPVGGRPMLGYLLDRLKRVRRAKRLVVATSHKTQDDPIVSFCEAEGVGVFRGDELDTFDRFKGAADAFGADIAVRVTGDCPLLDPATVDLVIDAIVAEKCDYVSTDLVPQYPNGMGCDAYARRAVEKIHIASRGGDPERSWMFTRESGLGLACASAPASRLGNLSAYRVTVDTPEDLMLVSKIVGAFPAGAPIGLEEIVALLDANPDWRQINGAVRQKTGPHSLSA